MSTDDSGHTDGNEGKIGEGKTGVITEAGHIVDGEYRWEGLRMCVTGQCVAG